MPIGIGVEGGTTRRVARENIQDVTSEQSLESLQKIRTHLSQPGRESGVLTLYNRTSSGSEMKLERKSGFLWELDLWLDNRLDDTVVALRTMLQKAGQHEALKELDDYLGSQGGRQNRIEAGKMSEILNRHLPREEVSREEEPLEEGSLKQEPLEKVPLKEDLRPLPPPKKLSPLEELCTLSRIEKGQKLGTGNFGSTYLVKMDGKDGVLKEFRKPQPLSLMRSGKPNEAMGSYLTSNKSPNYHLDKVNIAQPTFYMISMRKEGKDVHQMVTPHEMRHLVKEAMNTRPRSEVMCHGLLMPKAKGKEVSDLIKERTLSDGEKKQFVRSTLQSIKGLNERGFVHRDIKPQNSFFDSESGTTTLIDTGTLFKTSKDQEKHPGTEYIGEAWGTERYMSPRALQRQEHGTETDLYALGVMTLEVDHPRAFQEILEWSQPRDGITPQWLHYRLDERIGGLDRTIQGLEPSPARDELVALRDALDAVRKDIDDPETLSGFAMKCIEMAGRPAEFWKDRDKAQGAYSELLSHSGLQ